MYFLLHPLLSDVYFRSFLTVSIAVLRTQQYMHLNQWLAHQGTGTVALLSAPSQC